MPHATNRHAHIAAPEATTDAALQSQDLDATDSVSFAILRRKKYLARLCATQMMYAALVRASYIMQAEYTFLEKFMHDAWVLTCNSTDAEESLHITHSDTQEQELPHIHDFSSKPLDKVAPSYQYARKILRLALMHQAALKGQLSLCLRQHFADRPLDPLAEAMILLSLAEYWYLDIKPAIVIANYLDIATLFFDGESLSLWHSVIDMLFREYGISKNKNPSL